MTKMEIEKRIAELNEELKVLRAMRKEITDAEKPIVVEYEEYIGNEYLGYYELCTERFENREKAEKWIANDKKDWSGIHINYNIHK